MVQRTGHDPKPIPTSLDLILSSSRSNRELSLALMSVEEPLEG